MENSADELRAILSAYQQLAAASWPDLNPTMKSRASRWGTASEAELRSELDAYVRDAEMVVKTGKANLDIIERQESAAGEMTWVRAGKAPLKLADGTVFGIIAMYEIVDAATGRALFMKSQKAEGAKA